MSEPKTTRRARVKRPERTEESIALGASLRSLRTLADLNQHDIAAAIKVAQSTVQRAEAGTQLLSRGQVAGWLAKVGADQDLHARVMAEAEAAHTSWSSWASMLASQDAPHLQGVAAQRDDQARLVRSYQTAWLPGLLQTAEYARHLLPLVDPTGAMDYAAAVGARMQRQQILYRGAATFEFVITEQALRWSPAPGLMHGQHGHLAALAQLANVDVAILPAREGVPGWHSFDYRVPLDGDPYVTLELLNRGLTVDQPDAVELYETLWSRLWEAAAHGDDALAFIRKHSH